MENIEKVLSQICEILLRLRIWRTWQKNNAVCRSEFSEQDILVLMLARDYGPITADELCNIFGFRPSSAHEIVEKLQSRNFLKYCSKDSSDNRKKPLELTDSGREQLGQFLQLTATRYEYHFGHLDENKLAELMPLLEAINTSVDRKIKLDIFSR